MNHEIAESVLDIFNEFGKADGFGEVDNLEALFDNIVPSVLSSLSKHISVNVQFDTNPYEMTMIVLEKICNYPVYIECLDWCKAAHGEEVETLKLLAMLFYQIGLNQKYKLEKYVPNIPVKSQESLAQFIHYMDDPDKWTEDQSWATVLFSKERQSMLPSEIFFDKENMFLTPLTRRRTGKSVTSLAQSVHRNSRFSLSSNSSNFGDKNFNSPVLRAMNSPSQQSQHQLCLAKNENIRLHKDLEEADTNMMDTVKKMERVQRENEGNVKLVKAFQDQVAVLDSECSFLRSKLYEFDVLKEIAETSKAEIREKDGEILTLKIENRKFALELSDARRNEALMGKQLRNLNASLAKSEEGYKSLHETYLEEIGEARQIIEDERQGKTNLIEILEEKDDELSDLKLVISSLKEQINDEVVQKFQSVNDLRESTSKERHELSTTVWKMEELVKETQEKLESEKIRHLSTGEELRSLTKKYEETIDRLNQKEQSFGEQKKCIVDIERINSELVSDNLRLHENLSLIDGKYRDHIAILQKRLEVEEINKTHGAERVPLISDLRLEITDLKVEQLRNDQTIAALAEDVQRLEYEKEQLQFEMDKLHMFKEEETARYVPVSDEMFDVVSEERKREVRDMFDISENESILADLFAENRSSNPLLAPVSIFCLPERLDSKEVVLLSTNSDNLLTHMCFGNHKKDTPTMSLKGMLATMDQTFEARSLTSTKEGMGSNFDISSSKGSDGTSIRSDGTYRKSKHPLFQLLKKNIYSLRR
uniref:Uncharacterized protein n=1 Tax=Rhabditophanes sp. KR3021 TaxID=114890 RepID=A0AC35TS45_9BILA